MTEKKNETPETPAEEPKAESAPSGPSQTAQATAAASAAITTVREKLVAGEQFMLSAAGGIVVIYLIWQFLLDYRIFVDNFPVIIAVLTVLAIWVHRWGHYDFGTAYRIILGALGVVLALFALMNLLGWARLGGGSVDFLHLIGRLLYWAAGVAAFVGAWQVFRTRED
jgi:hypothetical protein